MQSLTQPRYQPPTGPPQGDYIASLWTGYLNCVNALRIPMTIAESGAMVTAPSVTLFEGSVDIWQAQLLERIKDQLYRDNPGKSYHERFHAIIELLDRQHVFKEKTMDLGHV